MSVNRVSSFAEPRNPQSLVPTGVSSVVKQIYLYFLNSYSKASERS